ncbi:MAG: chaperonin GroEL [Phycisphaeraceae bacterium]|nr:chaperonin GroEL [Phycisphaeraceae bacterium]
MTTKQLNFRANAQQKLKRGVDQIAQAVAVTMGPTGRNVVVQKSYGGPSVTKDGVSVAKEVELPCPFENMGAKMVHQVAKKTADVAGDGTTAATVLAAAIFNGGLKFVASGANPVALQRGINAAANSAADAIIESAQKCKGRADLEKIATVSANHDTELGALIAEAIDKVGHSGVVEVEEGKTADTTLEYVEGMAFDKGYLSPYFMTDPKKAECVLENALILIHEKKISNLADLLPLLNKVALSQKPLLIIAEEVENEALAALVVNRLRGVLKVCAVKAPGFGDRRKAMLGDIAVLTGGTFFAEDLGRNLSDVELNELGTAKKLIVTKDDTVIVQGAGKKKDIEARAAQIQTLHDKSTSEYDREKFMERLAKLTGGVAVINVGAATETAMKEKKDRVDDAIHATRAAAKEGYVPGGGVAFIRAIEALESGRRSAKGDEKFGFDIVAEALTRPTWQIASNSGIDGDLVVERVREGKGAFGFNASTGEYQDLVKAGIIDPALVEKTALLNAASVAGLMLTTDVLITELKDDAEPVTGSVS